MGACLAPVSGVCAMSVIDQVLIILFVIAQLAYLCIMLIELYFITRPVNRVDMEELEDLTQEDYPDIILFYPVLRELESTMRTTFVSLANLHYPTEKFRIVAIPNDNDLPTVESLERLAREFPSSA
jgi:cellulose synthase/poly-beta-1,6-N-acetylglucosamine synthase-like glycosyltransferase